MDIIDITNQNPSIMVNVKKTTRASKNGTAIFCPHCKGVGIVYSFNWSSAQCSHCKKWILKTQYLLDENISGLAKNLRKLVSIDVTHELIERIIRRTPKNSIIDQTKQSINETPDYILYLNFKNAVNSLENFDIVEEDKFAGAFLIVVQQYYEQEESNDIGELRKQKLLKIKNNANQDERENI